MSFAEGSFGSLYDGTSGLKGTCIQDLCLSSFPGCGRDLPLVPLKIFPRRVRLSPRPIASSASSREDMQGKSMGACGEVEPCACEELNRRVSEKSCRHRFILTMYDGTSSDANPAQWTAL
jgi:hypothetical protein